MIPKNFNGLYIINERTIVTIDLFTYPNILLNKRDFLSSGFVLIGTDVIAILVLPAWTIVSSVYVFTTFNLKAASLLYALKPLGASGMSDLEATRTVQLPKCCNFFLRGEK